ncbi:MAG: hypothetical protein RLZ04_2293 [Actinomycetota bacterium]|jgi:hypothetical protein
MAIASTMVVLREPGEVYLLCHTAGEDAISWVEQIDPLTLETVRRSPDLPGGPTWPGGMAAHADGGLYVVFGQHAHRLSSDLADVHSVTLPRRRPYNSFVVLPDGHLVTKDFAGRRPTAPDGDGLDDSELLLLAPGTLEIVARLVLPERSIARLSADGDDIYAVGDTSLLRVRRDGVHLTLDDSFRATYRTMEGQTYGWDAVIADGCAWLLDNGAGSERYTGTLRGNGISTAPLHVVRVSLADGSVSTAEVCGLPGGLIANPPAVDPSRRIVVGYDSGNGVVTAFRYGSDPSDPFEQIWSRPQNHAAHPLLYPDTGELVLHDHDAERQAEQVVVLDVESGREILRADTGSPVQSVLFPAAGWGRSLYSCSFFGVSRLSLPDA